MKGVMKCLCLLCLSLCMCFPAFAETDAYGNEITWDTNGQGDEEGAGAEDLSGNDSLSGDFERTERTDEEREAIAEFKAEIDNKKTEGTGTVNLRFEAPENWIGDNVYVKLYNKDNWKFYEVYAMSQNQYMGIEDLPYGYYEVRTASVVGDLNNRYELSYDVNGKASFQLDETNKNALITVRLKKLVEFEKEDTPAESRLVKEPEKVEEEKEKSLFVSVFEANLPFLLIGIVLAIGFFAFKIKSSDKDERNYN